MSEARLGAERGEPGTYPRSKRRYQVRLTEAQAIYLRDLLADDLAETDLTAEERENAALLHSRASRAVETFERLREESRHGTSEE